MTSPTKKLTPMHFFIYFGTFMVYASLHGLRAGWSFSKPKIQSEFHISKDMLGIVDALYLAAYTAGFAIMGSLIHRFSLKSYVVTGLALSSISYMLWVLCYSVTGFYNEIFMICAMTVSGFGQATGWPGIIAILNNWFEGTKKGLLMGLWATNAMVGNILASNILNILEDNDVSFVWNFFVTGSLGLTVAVILLLFLKEKPDHNHEDLLKSMLSDRESDQIQEDRRSSSTSLSSNSEAPTTTSDETAPEQTVTFKYGIFSALTIPRVPSYALAYACLKGCTYGLLFWLPSLLEEVQGEVAQEKGFITSMVDVGGIFGVIFLGFLTDKLNKKAIFLTPSLICSSIFMSIVAFSQSDSVWPYYITIFLTGGFVNGPYKMIGTIITLDIGNRIKEKSSVAKVSSLIEGSAAIFAMLEMVLIPYLEKSMVFYLFTTEMVIAALLLLPGFVQQVKMTRKVNKVVTKDEEKMDNCYEKDQDIITKYPNWQRWGQAVILDLKE